MRFLVGQASACLVWILSWRELKLDTLIYHSERSEESLFLGSIEERFFGSLKMTETNATLLF
jgi:hypothetical protein